MRRYKNNPKHITGFTLVELVLVTAMLSVVGLAAYSAFSNGIRLWKRVNEEVIQEDINMFFVKISRDLRNLSRYSGIEFTGEPDSISFPSVVTHETEGGVMERIIGQVTYVFDENRRLITGGQSDYSELYQSKAGRARTLVDDIDLLSFQYYCYDPDSEEYLWLKAWNDTEAPPGVKTGETLPLAIKVEIEPNGDKKGKEFTRIVTLPVGG